MNIQIASKVSLFLSLSITTLCVAETTQLSTAEVSKLTPAQQLGKHIFFDENLSSPAGQSCASCHDPKTAFSDANLSTPVSNGAVEGRTGTRNTPPLGYTVFSPVFHFDNEESLYFGGQFLDGRAANLTEQAKKPFLNADEMNNRDEAEVVDKLRFAAYADLFKQVYGLDVLNNTNQAFQAIADALAAFENAPIFNRFSSKYDYFLAGQAELTEQERDGLELFNDAKKGNCAACHPSSSDNKQPPLFTDFSYDNLGTPKNPAILAKKGQDFVDLGLGAIVNNVNENGKFKVPTLRNIAKTAPYMHNGVFQTLREAVDFYNSRDTDPKWPAPEVAENVNKDELGSLNLNAAEIDAIVAFLRTLTDGYHPETTAYFAADTGLLTLPLVSIESNTAKTAMISAVLKEIEGSNPSRYRMIDLQESKLAAPSDAGSIPSFFTDTGLLEIPLISVGNETVFTAQLKRITDNNENFFELVYLKLLQ